MRCPSNQYSICKIVKLIFILAVFTCSLHILHMLQCIASTCTVNQDLSLLAYIQSCIYPAGQQERHGDELDSQVESILERPQLRRSFSCGDGCSHL